MKPGTITFIKIALSIPAGIGLVYPFFDPTLQGGILGEMQLLGPAGSLLVAVGFLVLVFFYARDLKRVLQQVSPTARQASPNSVWFMFLLPYNFIEDFFIVAIVANSLAREARSNPALAAFRSFGMVSGLGWCAAQLVSLIPNLMGSIGGLVAIVLWIWHWQFVRRAGNALLRAATATR